MRELPRHDERALLADVVALDEAIDPIDWLAREHKLLAARIALRGLLESCRDLCACLQRRGMLRTVPPLERVPPEVWNFAWLQDPPDATSQAVVDALRRLQSVHWTVDTAPLIADPWAQARLRALLEQLLSLPDDADPVQWLSEQAPLANARETVSRLIEQHKPGIVPWRDIGQVVRTYHPRAVLQSGGLRLVIDEVSLGQRGFRLVLHARIPDRRVRALCAEPLQLHWVGFRRVADNNARRYLPQHFFGEWGKEFWYQGGRLEITFYPAVTPDASALSFTATPAVVTARRARRDVDLAAERLILVGEPLVWRLAL